MATEVVKVELKNVQDASGLEAAIRAGRFTADQVVAVVGKTEGNGGVNDFTRILADQASGACCSSTAIAAPRTSRGCPWCGRADAMASSPRTPPCSRGTSAAAPPISRGS